MNRIAHNGDIFFRGSQNNGKQVNASSQEEEKKNNNTPLEKLNETSSARKLKEQEKRHINIPPKKNNSPS